MLAPVTTPFAPLAKPAPDAAAQPRAELAAQASSTAQVKRAETTRPALPSQGFASPRSYQASETLIAEAGADGLTEEQRQVVEKLAARDREVRQHEQAHMMVGGPYAGQASYSYQNGPDGKRYAIGGEVPIDISPVKNDPEATIAKMQIVRAAALAPAEPSSQDLRVAAEASSRMMSAQVDLASQKREDDSGAARAYTEQLSRLGGPEGQRNSVSISA